MMHGHRIPLGEFSEDCDPFFLAYTALEDARNAALVQFIVVDGVGACSMLDLPGGELVRWEFVVGEVGEEGLCP